jgi:hypothetical protein
METDNSLVTYYKDLEFNPVHIPVENGDEWEVHVAKRRNLYENHLKIPFSLLRDREVIEFGCNSGENALVLGAMGAKLTLVEPNEQVIPRLEDLFNSFHLNNSIDSINHQSIETFNVQKKYDIAIAEGYLNILSTRDDMLKKLCDLLVPGGIGIISFDDTIGSFIELVKRAIIWRACELKGVKNIQSVESLNVAKEFFLEDFGKISTSRNFESWWRDQLISPFYCLPYLWSYKHIIPLIEKGGCEIHATSPTWTFDNHFTWYKDLLSQTDHHTNLLKATNYMLPFFISGIPYFPNYIDTNESYDIQPVDHFIQEISDYTSTFPSKKDFPCYPKELESLFNSYNNAPLQSINFIMKNIFNNKFNSNYEKYLFKYISSKQLRNIWGTPYHYISFLKRS